MPRRTIDPGLPDAPTSGETMESVFSKVNANFGDLFGAPGSEESPLSPPLPLIWNAPPTATGALAVAGEFRGVPVHVPYHLRVNRARVRVGSPSAALFAVGIYAADGSEKVSESDPAAVSAGAAAANLAVVLDEVVLGPGFYFVGLVCNSTAPSWSVTMQLPVLGGGVTAGVDVAALPASVAVGNATVNNAPVVGLYRA